MVASYRLGAADHFDWHEHGAHQLSVAADGVVCMGVDERDRMWVLPWSWALWILARPCPTPPTPSAGRR